MLFGAEIYMLSGVEIYLLQRYFIYIYIYNIETWRADLEIRENKQVKDLYKRGQLELENKDYVKPVFGEKGRKPREESEERKRQSPSSINLR